ncbi:fasciclin domain-containing protein [Fodinibius sp. AD559]|uniref:fasciclin domain-containing protein n=1 Tax=Fodinibius sp. AD559 TaxID=3424179 RepID=UPI004046E7B7
MKFSQKIFRLALALSFLVTLSDLQAQTIVEKLKSNSQTTQFVQALENTGVDDRLNQSGPFTVFAPTNAAFNNLSIGQKSDSNLLLNHILTGMATKRSLRAMSDITCLSGKTISIQNQSGNNLAIESNRISTSNIKASNGVIHIIDGVIE